MIGKLIKEIEEKSLQIAKEQAQIIEEKIKEVVCNTGCNVKDITLEVHQDFKYKILVKHSEFEFYNNFTVKDND